MALSRRTLLRGSLAAAGAAAVWGGYTALRRGPGLLSRFRSAARRAASTALPPASPGTLADATLRPLLAAADAVLGEPAARPQYAELLCSRAEALPGYRSLYERFAARLEEEAGAGFPDLPRARRLEVVTRLAPPGRLARLRLGLAGDERALFRRYVVVELLSLYAATDAWTALGYGGWPGVPRGLTGYRRPVAGTRGTP